MSFESRKEAILKQLEAPEEEYSDLSPKGSIDVAIQDLINEINAIPGLVTTSSCSGRVAVYLEGQKSPESSGISGKGGGKWLFVAHEPLNINESAPLVYSLFRQDVEVNCGGMMGTRLVHFKFEPMILHILTASLADAQRVLVAALQAGFRESGAINLLDTESRPATPMVAVRTAGLGLDCIIGYATGDGDVFSMVTKSHIDTLMSIANDRFQSNTDRIDRFRHLIRSKYNKSVESKEQRRARKKAQGLRLQQMQERTKEGRLSAPLQADTDSLDLVDLNFSFHDFEST